MAPDIPMQHRRNLPVLKLYQTDEHAYSSDCIAEFYDCILADKRYHTQIKTVSNLQLKAFWISVFRRLIRIAHPSIGIPLYKGVNFSAQIGPDLKMCLPDYFYSKNNYIYMFDAWPRFHEELNRMLDIINVKAIFFSSKEVTLRYQHKFNSGCKAYWVPEGIQAAEYSFKPYADKTIDVLEFGRTYQNYHNQIKGPLAEANKSHLFSTPNQPILFKTKSEFKNALALSKISICIPSNITHPERAEDISTMTLRYLQSMASKCLIVGIMPEEMLSLFGYRPIVEIDQLNPGAQIIEILNNFERYYELIERNYNMVHAHHQWKHRWDAIEAIMKTNI